MYVYIYTYACIYLYIYIHCKPTKRKQPTPPNSWRSFGSTFASLCHGALTPKRRAAVRPLLLALRENLQRSNAVGVEAVELLAAAAECLGDELGWVGWEVI